MRWISLRRDAVAQWPAASPVSLLIVGLAIVVATAPACAPPRAPARPPREMAPRAMARPMPTATPQVAPPTVHRLGEPGAAPTPLAADATRSPLTSRLGVNDPENVVSALQMGDLARRELEAGTTVRAFELLDAAIQMAPERMELYVVRAQAHLAEGSSEPARADLQRAEELQPDAPWLAEIIADNGAADEVEGRPDRALAAYRRALRLYPANQTARAALQRLSEP
jgi:Tfp pilus assembly protein PilF